MTCTPWPAAGSLPTGGKQLCCWLKRQACFLPHAEMPVFWELFPVVQTLQAAHGTVEGSRGADVIPPRYIIAGTLRTPPVTARGN